MSPILDSSVQPRLTSQARPSNPRSRHKRKREEAGDTESSAPDTQKRSRIKHPSTDNPNNSQAQKTEVVKSVPKVERGKDGDHAIRSKATKPLVISETKLAKRERRKARREQESRTHNRSGEGKKPNGTSPSSGQDVGSELTEHQRATARKKKPRENGGRLESTSTWSISEPIGGRFIESEPLFSADEKYLIVAKEALVEVYSTSTSSLVRSLAIGYRSPISAYSLSTVNPHILFVSTFAGTIYKWDWIEGKKLARWDVSSQITGLATEATPNADEDIVYTIDKSDKSGAWMVTAHKLMAGNQASESELCTLCKSQEPITGLKVMEGGRTLVATSGRRLMVGLRNDRHQTSLATTTYTWREITLPECITCFDARLPMDPSQLESAGSEMAKNRNIASKSLIDVVVGNTKGEIYIYKDLLDILTQRERRDKAGKAASLTASLQHWHRDAVNTVKWSRDGNYVISGGVETVLVLWQLDTGARQYLPHLSSAIETLVVSPTGSAYALGLADNSIMVLSTTELKPTASIAGIQSYSQSRSHHRQQHLGTGSSVVVHGLGRKEPLKAPAAVNPLNPAQLMLAVSASRSSRPGAVTINRAAFLQTFDLTTAQHISRQALARNNTTVVNIGGSGEKIREPDITHMQVSHNGQWLATVDDWLAPVKDIEHLVMKDHVEEGQETRREVFLKFWSWSSEGNEWRLVTRVDAPHAPHGPNYGNGAGAGQVLAFAADPSDLGFASLGEDGGVYLWRPKTRRRNGIQVRDRNANGLVTWSTRHVICLPTPQESLSTGPLKAAIAFSADGSLLAACLQSSSANESSVVHFIDTISGEIRQSRPGLFAGDLVDMGIVDRYLVIMSDQLIVWDMVDDELHFGLSLRLPSLSSQTKAIATHLTVNQRHRTFAIALPVEGNEKRNQRSQALHNSQSKVAIFDPSLPTPLYTTTLPHTVTSLLPATDSRGYVFLDSAAEVRILSPKAVTIMPSLVVDAGSTSTPRALGLESLYGQSQTTSVALDRHGSGSSADESDAVSPPLAPGNARPPVYDDDDAPVISQQQLAAVFDNNSAFAMPPVERLFEGVVGLFARKPRMA